ncbi:ubiquinone biosynthesis O-methyltransferase [Dentipellis sp. KUC8613]|nr:ubiquinone biosynthesis O-methyltransferase [Dentipellis sp. KUC8613]
MLRRALATEAPAVLPRRAALAPRRRRQPIHTSPAAHNVGTTSTTSALPSSSSTAPPLSTVNQAEIAHFSRLSSLWWDEHGEFALLHRMNPTRAQFVRDKVREAALDDHGETQTHALEGLDVLDVGCGGGILAESLARMGARTLGVDASAANIAIASLHAAQDPLLAPDAGRLAYRHASAEELVREQRRFDVVCSMEVLEHVDNPAAFLASCAELVKPGGHLFLSTIARTPLAYLLTIFAAEDALRLVAPGTHTYSKFVNPTELIDFFARHGATEEGGKPWISRTYGGQPPRREAEVRGMMYVPWRGEWVLAPRVAGSWGAECNYLFWVRKPAA